MRTPQELTRTGPANCALGSGCFANKSSISPQKSKPPQACAKGGFLSLNLSSIILTCYLVEAGGIEPPSENALLQASTGLDRKTISPQAGLPAGPPLASPPLVSRSPRWTEGLRQPDGGWRSGSAYQASADGTLTVIKQPERNRNRWQLTSCRVFYEASRHLGLQPGLCYPRRNQGAPVDRLPMIRQLPRKARGALRTKKYGNASDSHARPCSRRPCCPRPEAANPDTAAYWP